MRLKSIEVAGFRAFGAAQQYSLDADALVLVGPNGSGKTSLLDAILWALAGQVPRVEGGDPALVSMFSDTGGARVALDLDDAEQSIRVVRSFDGTRTSLLVQSDKEELRGSAANAHLYELLWPEALSTPDEASALTEALTRSVYLQQDLVRQFVEADTDHDRFSAISEIVGAGRVGELQVQLDNERTAWSRVLNERREEAEAIRTRLESLERRLADLADAEDRPDSESVSRLESWLSKAKSLGLSISDGLEAQDPRTAQMLDDLLGNLAALQRTEERRAGVIHRTIEELHEKDREAPPDVEVLRAAAEAADEARREAQANLEAAESQAAEERQRHVEAREARAEIRSLATLALRHLGERCPVCDQNYNEDETRTRLEELARAQDDAGTDDSASQQVQLAAEASRSAEKAHREALAALRREERSAQDFEDHKREVVSRLKDVGVDWSPDLAIEHLEVNHREVAERANLARDLQLEGETLSLYFARAAEAARRAEIEREAGRVKSQLDALASDVKGREKTRELAVALLEGLREASSEVVRSELERMDPLLKQVFSTVDPHPAFRAVQLVTRFSQRRGRITAQIEDPMSERRTETPQRVLSSSQLNGLAVAIFLTLNLGVRSLPLQTLVLDDPLQSLDDVNLLGLVDLLRRTKEHRQVIVSTHDPRFGDLLARKLRPVDRTEKTLIHEFRSWSRKGPLVETREVESDPQPLRIAEPAA